MDLLIQDDTKLIEFIKATSNVLTYEGMQYFFLGNQVVYIGKGMLKYQIISQFEYSQLPTEIKNWIFDCISQSLQGLIS